MGYLYPVVCKSYRQDAVNVSKVNLARVQPWYSGMSCNFREALADSNSPLKSKILSKNTFSGRAVVVLTTGIHPNDRLLHQRRDLKSRLVLFFDRLNDSLWILLGINHIELHHTEWSQNNLPVIV